MQDTGLSRDRVSITRIEGGKQMPPIEVLEMIQKIVKAPSVTAMVDYTPTEWERIETFLSMSEEQQEMVLRIAKAAKPS